MLPVSLLVSVALMAVVDGMDLQIPECRNRHSVRQRHELICPARAVCGDEWVTVRDWRNGTRCREQRVVVNCKCPGNKQCPIGDANHLFYANEKHREYLCEEKCSVGMCSTRFRAAEELVQNSPAFDRNNYYRINCRCPGHNEPMETRPGVLQRSTTYNRLRFNFTENTVFVQYKCSGDEPLTGEDPVCGGYGPQVNLGLNGEEEDNWA